MRFSKNWVTKISDIVLIIVNVDPGIITLEFSHDRVSKNIVVAIVVIVDPRNLPLKFGPNRVSLVAEMIF